MHGLEFFGQSYQTVQPDRRVQAEDAQRSVSVACRRQLHRTASGAQRQRGRVDWLQSRVRDESRGTQRKHFRKFRHDELQYYRRYV